MPRRFPRTILSGCVALLLTLAACGQEEATPPAAEAPPQATSTTAIQPVVFEPPAAGQRMLWIDASPVVYVPGDSFVMGQAEQEPSDHRPAHTVTLNPFWIYQAEVTNRMYQTCVELGVCTEPTQSLWFGDPEYENAPVSGVDWTQAQAYCEWMNGRLPTEAEWELAARGTEGDPYPWGEDEPTCDLLNFLDCLIPSVPDAVRSYPLGASEYNLADMAGNVSEWVADWYGEDYYAASPGNNPLGPSDGEDKVVRGSSYLSPVENTEIYLRGSQNPLQSQPTIGFRCVVKGEAPAAAPVCNMLSYEPTWDPMGPAEEASLPPGNATGIAFYCGSDQADVHVDYRDTDHIDTDDVHATSPQGAVDCTGSDDMVHYLFFCSGSAIQSGHAVTITICVDSPVQLPEEPSCPNFYEYNPATGMCEYEVGHTQAGCQGGIAIEGYGCLYPPEDGQCPAGYYSATFEGDPVCVPFGGVTWFDPEHPPASCPPGMVFNEGGLCCEYPSDVFPACPTGFVFNAEQAMCMPDLSPNCTTISGVAPSCEPTEEPPPPPNCLSIGEQGACVAAGCTWTIGIGPPCH